MTVTNTASTIPAEQTAASGVKADRIAGIHHITAFAAIAKENLAFYTKVLGLRLVKQTVNFDDPGTYHFYFGDYHGRPGSILTFFPIEHAAPGRRGTGEVAATTFAVPRGSLGFWRERLAGAGVQDLATETRFGSQVVTFSDHDGTSLELVEVTPGESGTAPLGATTSPSSVVPAGQAIGGFFGATLRVRDIADTGSLLTGTFGHEVEATEGRRTRYVAAAPASEAGRYLDVVTDGLNARLQAGAGTVHHIALRVSDDTSQQRFSDRLSRRGYQVTEQRDRSYFRSVYFRERGGVLFELATDGPGFATDEPVEALGGALKLPAWLERGRREIAAALPAIR